MAPVTIKSSARGWREVSTTAFWTARVLWDTGTALYAVVQDTGATPKVRVMKANSRTSPSSWTEQDSANNKTITNVDYPYSSWYDPTGNMLHVLAFTAASTLSHYRFNCATDLWTTSFTGSATTAASNIRPVRCTVRSDGDFLGFFTSSADTADLGWLRWEGSFWTDSATQINSVNSAEASTVLDAGIDSTDRAWVAYYNCLADTVNYRTINGSNSVAAAVTIEATGATAETAHPAGGRFNLYVDGTTDKIVAAYLNSGPAIDERIISLEADANSANLATEAAVEATAADVGARTPISTAVVSGTPYAVWWDDASSGTIKYSTKSGGSWAAETNFATGITRLIEVVPVSTGLAVVYQSGSDVVMDFIVATAAGDTGTVSSGSLSVTGQTVTAQTGAVGSVSTGSVAVTGQTMNGGVSMTGSVATGTHTVAGQTVTAGSAVSASIGTGSYTVTGQTVTAEDTTFRGSVVFNGLLIADRPLDSGELDTLDATPAWTLTTLEPVTTGTIGTGSLVVAGQAVQAATGVVAPVSTGSLSVTGQTVTASTGSVATVATGELAITGQTIDATAASSADATVDTGTLAVSGQTVAANSGAVASVSTSEMTVAGQAVSVTATATGDLTTGTLSVTGQAISGTYDTTGAVATGDYATSGSSIVGTFGTSGSIATGMLTVDGQVVDATAGVAGVETGTVSTGSYSVTGQNVTATSGVNAAITTGSMVVDGQTVTSSGSADGTVLASTYTVTGQTVLGVIGTTGLLETTSYTVTGQTVSAAFGQTATFTTGTLVVIGGTVDATITGTGDLDADLAVGTTLTATVIVTQTMSARTETETTMNGATTTDTVLAGRSATTTPLLARLGANYGE